MEESSYARPQRVRALRVPWTVLVCALLVGPAAASLASRVPAFGRPQAPGPEAPSTIPLGTADPTAGYFIKNEGQATAGVLYYSMGNPSVGFRDDGVMFVVYGAPPREVNAVDHRNGRPSTALVPPSSSASFAYLVRFEGASRVVPVGVNELPFRSNFFLGNDPARWRTGVRNYAEVVYEGLYDGITLAYRVTPQGTKYEFLVAPGADPNRIAIGFAGVDFLAVQGGDLVAGTDVGVVRDSAPVADQGGDPVPCAFVLRAPGSAGFACSGRDPSRPLVIDPLIYSTFLGGPGTDAGSSIAVDSTGNAYVLGPTNSVAFPVTPSAYDPTYNGDPRGEWDMFVTKLDPIGRTLVYSTFLGGNLTALGESIAVDPAGNAYVTGHTYTQDYPVTPGAFQGANPSRVPGWSAFVTKLNASGDALVYSTYVGGSSNAFAYSIALDSTGAAYVTGETDSPDFPLTPDAFQRNFTYRGSHTFVTKLNPEGTGLEYSTFLRGEDWGMTVGHAIDVDSRGNAYVGGITDQPDFPVTPGAFDTTFDGGNPAGYMDAFVTKFNATGTGLIYSTFLGGGGDEFSWPYPSAASGWLQIDAEGNAYIVGNTNSSDFPVTPGAFDGTLEGRDVFVTKLNANGSALVYSTYLGGSGNEYAYDIAVDAGGDAFVVGNTSSPDFPVTPGAFDTTYGNGDMFVTRLNADGTALVYSTFLGGSDSREGAASVALDPLGYAYVTGYTFSPDFPITPGVFQRTIGGNGLMDAFVTKLLAVAPSDLPDLLIVPQDISFGPPGPVTAGTLVTIHAIVHNVGGSTATGPNATGVVVRFHDGLPSGSNRIGSDGVVAPIPPFGGTAAPSVLWSADPPGVHEICVVADPDNVIREIEEDNNMACAPIEVLPPPMPDYVPFGPQPAGPTTIGLDLPLALSTYVRNQGTAPGSGPASIAFFNGSTPGLPFAVFTVPPVPVAGVAGPFAATWVSPPTPGTYSVAASIDYRNDIVESNETNDNVTWAIAVVPGPTTSLAVGQPNVMLTMPYVTSSTPLSFSVADRSGLGTRNTTYRVDGGPWMNYTASGPFTLPREGEHLVEWFSEDFAGNVEAIQSRRLRVDNTPPASTAAVGAPRYQAADLFVTSGTLVSLAAADGGVTPVGLACTEYSVDGGPWSTYASPFTLAGNDGPRAIEYRSTDLLGNAETNRTLLLVVDNTPPFSSVTVGTPKNVSDRTYVTSATPIALASVDDGAIPVGLASVEYRIEGGAWTAYAAPFTLSGPDGARTIEYRGMDRLGNTEATRSLVVVLDDTPPTTDIAPGTGLFTADTRFSLTATDAGCGVDHREYHVDGGPWTPYTSPFGLPAGNHVIGYRSVDRLNNTEAERTLSVTIAGTTELPVEFNWKPLIALVFSLVLVVAGAWSSRREPWKGGKGRRAAMTAFALTALPFVVLEAATGIVSLFTTLLLIPPALGVGTAVDVGILVAGLAVAAYRAVKARTPRSEASVR